MTYSYLLPGGGKNVHFTMSSRPSLGPIHPPNQRILGVLSPGVKRPGREANHSPPTSTEVKKNVDLYIRSPIRLYDVVLT
jgi:hypothetical protein